MPEPPHSPAEDDQRWLERVYRGDRVPQLTTRAVVLGAALGLVTGLSNLYVGLKIGWALGVVVTASVMGWALWRGVMALRLSREPLTPLEVNALASTASAAGYSTGTTLVSAVAAYLLIVGHHLPVWQLMLWLLSVSMFGLFVAVPLKRQLVNTEKLPFPTGAAAAQTIDSLCADTDESARRAKALFYALAVGAGLKVLTAVLPALGYDLVPPQLALFGAAAAYTWALDLSVLLPAAGVIVGWRVCASIGLGALVCFGWLVPQLHGQGVITDLSYPGILAWSVWPGVTLMVVAGLLSFALRWRSIARAFSGLGAALGRASTRDPLREIEVPIRWFAIGAGVSGVACVVLTSSMFDVPLGWCVVAVLLAAILAVVAARVTGETDLTPMGPLGKVAQLTFGLGLPGRIVPNLMAAGVTAGAAASAADLLTDLKSGHLLGANARKQFWAQFVGVLVGVACIVPLFRRLVPTAEALGTSQWPAPAARIWSSVAELLANGFSVIDPTAIRATWIAALVAAALTLAEHWRPAWRRILPSATGLGLAFVLPAFNSLSFFIGGTVALYITRKRPKAMAAVAIPIAAGLIAGESLLGVVAAVLKGWAV